MEGGKLRYFLGVVLRINVMVGKQFVTNWRSVQTWSNRNAASKVPTADSSKQL